MTVEPASSSLDQFLLLCGREMQRRAPLAAENGAVMTEGVDAFVTALEQSRPRRSDSRTVPVASWMSRLGSSGPGDLAAAAGSTAHELVWLESPRLAEGGTTAALAPLNLVRELGQVLAGLLLIAPGGVYPEHSHAPQEIYLPICGQGKWRYGGSDLHRSLGPDTLVYNHPNDVHRVQAGDEPLLALYVLWPVPDPYAALS